MQIDQLFVMVIEPSHLQRKIIVSALQELGVSDIEEFDQASEALSRMEVITPDLVLSAMHLPDMTGTDLVHRMRESEALADITFMLISSETHYRYLEPIRQSGAIAILPKPFEKADLASALNSTVAYLEGSDPEDEERFELMRVLVADDSRMSRKFIRQVLESVGISQIDEVENGAEALDAMQEHDYDLVVSDYNMPEVDGRELIAHIRRDSTQPSVPVLMITSEQNETRLAAVQNAGVSAICNKPIEFESIKTVISNLVRVD